MFSKQRLIGKCMTCYKATKVPLSCRLRCVSSNSAPLSKPGGIAKTENLNEIDKSAPDSNVTKRYLGVTNTPFTKNLFLGKFDKEVLVYPEIEDKDELNELNGMVHQVEKFFTDKVDSKTIDENAKIPDDVLQQLKDFGLFGQQIPVEYGGLGLNATKFARLSEATYFDGGISVTLAAHQAIGLKGILIAGTDEQKEKYLPRLATGELVAAFCLTESSSGSDAASIQTRATLSNDGQTFHITGSKIWISNGGIADIFTVFAKTEVTNEQGETQDKMTAFIVERQFGGVSNGKPDNKLGIRGSNTCEVHFENTPVPVDNVIGQVGGGFKIAMNVLNSGRFSMGSGSAGALKRLIGMTAEHAVSRQQFGKKLSEFGLIQEKFAKMAVQVYAMESMAYLTAGLMDMYEKPELSIEAAIVKIFSSEGMWMCINECLQILGGQGYMKDYPYERYLRDARILTIFEGTSEILRLFVALAGVQHAGKELKNLVKMLRNPLSHPKLVMKTAINRARGKGLSGDRSSLNLSEEVHPSLKTEAGQLEDSVFDLQECVECLLTRHGNEIIHEQMDLKRLADIAIDMYAMTACISRASRSYCIGLRNADHELLLVRALCQDASQRIKRTKNEILIGKVANLNETYRHIADGIFKHRGYVPEHPLTRNW